VEVVLVLVQSDEVRFGPGKVMGSCSYVEYLKNDLKMEDGMVNGVQRS
jgi:hypothetical protein